MKIITILAAAAAALLLAPALLAQPAPNEAEIRREIERISAQLHPQRGDVRVNEANAVLSLGEDYYFLPAQEARLVLVEGWGNPPDSTSNVLGMIFPAGKTFADDSWGAVVTYQPTGYVRDDDAESADYDALLQEMRAGEEERNAERRSLGYPTVHLVGWAQAPTYDRASHSLIWARNVMFEGVPENSLNYDVRLLGRRGVLSLNVVTTMAKLAETRDAAAQLARVARFQTGARYSDYQPDTDPTAEYGVAGLIAAGAGLTAAKKAGVLAVILALREEGRGRDLRGAGARLRLVPPPLRRRLCGRGPGAGARLRRGHGEV